MVQTGYDVFQVKKNIKLMIKFKTEEKVLISFYLFL